MLRHGLGFSLNVSDRVNNKLSNSLATKPDMSITLIPDDTKISSIEKSRILFLKTFLDHDVV